MGSEVKPDCWSCRYFEITWDRKFRYSCQALGFKSQLLPCLQVLQIDGRPCQAFCLKPELETKKILVEKSTKQNKTKHLKHGGQADHLA